MSAAPPVVGFINHNNARRQDWLAIFGGDEVPLRSPVAHVAQVQGEPVAVYDLDLGRLSKAQHAALVEHLVRRFHLEAEQVRAHLDRIGVWISVADVTVHLDPWMFL